MFCKDGYVFFDLVYSRHIQVDGEGREWFICPYCKKRHRHLRHGEPMVCRGCGLWYVRWGNSLWAVVEARGVFVDVEA